MRYFTFIVLCIAILSTSSQCNKADPPNGHLKLSVTYPEAVVENGTISFVPVPGVGAEGRLYDKDAICLGYKDAMLNIVKIGDRYVTSKYLLTSNTKGEILFNDIPSGEYYLIVFARQLYKYTEKYIEVKGGDTLKLTKKFTPDIALSEDLEPWDYEVPGY
jgi:hypothetical protein